MENSNNYVNNLTKEKLVKVGYKIIKEEKLPIPKKISIISPMHGIKTKNGSCLKLKMSKDDGDNEYFINIYTRLASFIKDKKGKYIDKEGNRLSRETIGRNLSLPKIKHTLAHEIAHLKYWCHTPQHRSYTEYLFNKVNELYED